MLKIVLDTNVILAAYLTRGAASKIVKKWAEGCFELLISEEIVEEYLRILLSQNIDSDLVADFSKQLDKYAKMVYPKQKINLVEDDPDDDKFFECAVEGQARYIVSNDKHLLKMANYKGINVLSVQQFIKLFEKKE